MDAEIQKVELSYLVDSAVPSLDVARIDASFTTDFVNASFDLSLVDATFTTSYTSPSYGVDYVRLTPTDFSVGVFILRQALGDTTAAFDSHTTTFLKSIADSASFAVRTNFLFERAVLDLVTTEDAVAIVANKNFYNQIAFSDASTNSFAKGVTNYAEAIEVVFRELEKTLNDFASVTDDLDGEASIEDDQVMSFVKVRVDTGTFSDIASVTTSFNRSFSDSAIWQDSALLGAGKYLIDHSTVSELLDRTVAFNRQFSDSATWQDTTRLTTSSTILDNSYASESNVKSFTRVRSDSASVADSGVIFSQDYVDNPYYFAEDYVGNAVNF